MELLAAHDASVIYQNKTILKDISLSIKAHDFITIIGPNGAGKSMLLKLLMGFYPSTKGKITKKANLRIGYVPQRMVSPTILPMTVARFLKLNKRISSENFSRVIKETEIENLLESGLHLLSSGEFQRVLLARALLRSPDILILDEPAQNMDVGGQLAFYKLLEKIYHERRCSILMVSHDLHLVMASSTQVICLYHHVCCSGVPEVVAKDPAFISLFGEDMAKMMTIYHHTHTHHHMHTQGDIK